MNLRAIRLPQSILSPNAQLSQLLRGDATPVVIGSRASWTRMKNLADARPARCPTGDSGDYVARTFCGEVANTDDPFRFKDANDFAQMFIARDEQWSALARRQFVRSSIASARLDKRERA